MIRKFRTMGIAVLAMVTVIFLAPGTAWGVHDWEIDRPDWTPIAGTNSTCNGAVAELPVPLDSSGLGFFSACFQKTGDVLWIMDWNTRPGGGIGWMQWVNQIKNPSGSWVDWRHGECWLSLGINNEASCDKDFYENSTVRPDGGHGSRVGMKACSSIFGCGSIVWVTNDA